MIRFVLRRLLSVLPTLFAVVTISFFVMRFAPGGPFNLERPLAPQTMANVMRTYGLDQTLWQQYRTYLAHALTGDFGPSLVYKERTVAELIGSALPYSVVLGLWALGLALIGGVACGTLAALRQNSGLDHLLMSVAALGVTVPNFVLGPVLTLVFAVLLGWLPAGGWGDGGFRDLLLPVVALGLPQLAVFARLTRGAMIEALKADHIRTARAYGLPPRVVILRHALRSALLPVVSYLAPCAAGLLTGSAVVETIFAIPGVGRYFVLGAINRDYTLVMGTVILIAIMVVLFNLVVDMAYGLLDPRVRHD